jgi:hypothetical protein
MARYSRTHLTGSTSGRPIPVAATATPGTLIHTATATAADYDELWLWVSNVTGTAATLTLEWGGVTDPGQLLVKAYSVSANNAPILVSNGLTLNGGVVVRAFSGTGAALNITGYINRITA